MLSPLPRRSGWAYHFARSPRRVSLPRKGCRVGLRIVLFEACSAFTHVTACTLALSPIRDTHSEGFSYFVTSIAAPVASGWGIRRVGFAPTGRRRLVTARTPEADVATARLPQFVWVVLACLLSRCFEPWPRALALPAVCILGNYHRPDDDITAPRDEFARQGLM